LTPKTFSFIPEQ